MDPNSFFADPDTDPAVFLNTDPDSDPAALLIRIQLLKNCTKLRSEELMKKTKKIAEKYCKKNMELVQIYLFFYKITIIRYQYLY